MGIDENAVNMKRKIRTQPRKDSAVYRTTGGFVTDKRQFHENTRAQASR